jgi:predicted CxxxxCH...CXXCH cytochrome family protein
VDSARAFINPALHVDGLVEVSAGNCSYCHGSAENPAPPSDTGGGSLVTLIGVGAHQAHLQGGSSSRPLECAECHLVPSAAEDPGHADGLPAEVTFSGIAAARDHTPSWDHVGANCSDTYCHGPTSPSPSPPPSWIEPGSLSCSSCHGAPPPAPHPQLTNCSHCHADTIADDDVTVFDRERHVDGVVDVDFDQACTSCHGDQNPAPPFDLAGHTATSALGVGAHQTHVLGTATSRPVPCNECHVVPEDVLDPGHIDTAGPAEVVLSGTAAAFGGTPSYMAGSCQNLSCHGALFPKGHKSGGTNTEPIWNHVDGTQATCGSCHGLPPPAPHPYNTPNCILCHEDVAADGQTFTRPDLHVDGIVTFTVP